MIIRKLLSYVGYIHLLIVKGFYIKRDSMFRWAVQWICGACNACRRGIPGGIRNRKCSTDHDKQGDEQQAIKLQ